MKGVFTTTSPLSYIFILRIEVSLNFSSVFLQVSAHKLFITLLLYVNQIKLYKADCRESINFKSDIADTPICCVFPNNNKQNPFINIFKMAIQLTRYNRLPTFNNTPHKNDDDQICCVPTNEN